MNAYSFRLPNVDGNLIGLSDYPEAKGFIIIFSCNHCPYVIGSEDRMIALHTKYEPQGYPVIAINSNDPLYYAEDSFERMKEKSVQKKFPFQYLHDASQATAKNFGAERTPHVFVLKKSEGGWLEMYRGSIDDQPKMASEVKQKFVEPVMDALLSNQASPFSIMPALGCTIKWKRDN